MSEYVEDGYRRQQDPARRYWGRLLWMAVKHSKQKPELARGQEMNKRFLRARQPSLQKGSPVFYGIVTIEPGSRRVKH
jgi:hypothetical protein